MKIRTTSRLCFGVGLVLLLRHSFIPFENLSLGIRKEFDEQTSFSIKDSAEVLELVGSLSHLPIDTSRFLRCNNSFLLLIRGKFFMSSTSVSNVKSWTCSAPSDRNKDTKFSFL